MARPRIKPSTVVNPTVYAYTTPTVPDHDGWLKIGYTEKQTVEKRTYQQSHTIDVPVKVEWFHNAIFDDGTYETFNDNDFRQYLIQCGYEKQNDRKTEYIRISPEEAESRYDEFVRNRGLLTTQGTIPYELRKEQNDAVQRALDYFKLDIEGEFLWNAKPRFGKTLSVYDLCKRMKASNVLIVTNRPAIANSWYDDYVKFLGTESGFVFVSEVDALKGKPYAISQEKYYGLIRGGNAVKRIEFISLQDLKGSLFFGGKYDKLKYISDEKWDLLVIDEAHEGVDTLKTDVAFDRIERKHTLHLSGTPFKAIASEKFKEDAIFNWTYVDEQKAKAAWKESPGAENPYSRMPTLCMYTYLMSEIIRKKVEGGIDIEGNQESFAFDLNEFFSTKTVNGKPEFIYNDEVNVFLDALVTQDKYPFSTDELRSELKHTLWLLNRVDSAKALARKLREEHPIFRNYDIIVAAGDGSIYDVKENEKSLNRVRKAIEDVESSKSKYIGTITISVGQLTTGVTVPEWSAVMMLSNISSPALYMQAAFRAQNPYTFRRGGSYRMKETAYVFDFDPARSLEIFETFSNGLSPDSILSKVDSETSKKNVRELLNFFPVIGEDKDGQMIELDAEKVLTIPRTIRSKEVVRSGFMSNYLFQNISNVFGAPQSVIDIIKTIEVRKDPGAITSGKALYVDENGNVQIPDDKVIGTAADLFGDKIYYEPEKLEEIIDKADENLEPPKEEQEIKRLLDMFDKDVTAPMISTAKEKYGKDLPTSSQNSLSRKINADAETTIKKAVRDHQINQNILDSEMEKAISTAGTIQERNEIVAEYKKKKEQATAVFKENLNGRMEKLVESAGEDIARQVQTNKVKKDMHEVEEKVRSHLRGFTRTIPAFLMAYGTEKQITLANFDTVIPDSVFKEVTSLSLQQFRLLRDGGSIVNSDGVKEYYEGHLFDQVVFDDSIKEFMELRKKLANYFDESSEEDIFDYIPPQKTNQIFTPKKIVRDMVNKLELENPGCFDDDTKTFADLYMKSGLYLAEIVKRLYQSRRMKLLHPDDNERLNHIFSKQVFGLAPTEIIYRICKSFLLGFDDDAHIIKHNIRRCDSLYYIKEGTLEKELERVFSDDYVEVPVSYGEEIIDQNITVGEKPPYTVKAAPNVFSVTSRVRSIRQPRGGYIDPKALKRMDFNDGITLYDESISPSTMGLVVDYLTRFDQGAPVSDAFRISLLGADLCNRRAEADIYASHIKGLDDDSILNACRLVWFDQVYRAGTRGFGDPLDAVPDHETCENVRVMVKRSDEFFKLFGPVVTDGPTFPGGYSEIIVSGDGDFTTKDTIWDFKVSKNLPTIYNTLQVAIYFLMAKRSTVDSYTGLMKIGIFNPRLNAAFQLDMSQVPEQVLDAIRKDVIGYTD